MAATSPEIVTRMYADYLDWFRDVCGTRGFEPVRIHVGDPRERPTILTRQDWRSLGPGLSQLGGRWELEVTRPGRYEVNVHLAPGGHPTTAHLRLQRAVIEESLPAGAEVLRFPPVSLTDGPAELHVWIDGPDRGTSVLDATVARAGSD
jgi:hypothetical protein